MTTHTIGLSIHERMLYPDRLQALLARFAPVLGGTVPELPLPLTQESSDRDCGEWGWADGSTSLTTTIALMDGNPREGYPFDMKHCLEAPHGTAKVELQSMTIGHNTIVVTLEIEDLGLVPALFDAARGMFGPYALRNGGYGDPWSGTLKTLKLLMESGHEDVARPLLEDGVCWALETNAAEWQTKGLFEAAETFGVPTPTTRDTPEGAPRFAESRAQVYILGVSAGAEHLEGYLAMCSGTKQQTWAQLESARTGAMDCLEWMLDRFDLGEYELTDMYTEAAHGGVVEALDLLVEHGAKATKADDLLMHAACWGDPSVISNLVEQGADPNVPLRAAVEHFRPETVTALLAAGAEATKELVALADELHQKYEHSYTSQAYKALRDALTPPQPQASSPEYGEAPEGASGHPEIVYEEPGEGPDEPPHVEGKEYLGTFQCAGALTFCERSRFGQAFDEEAFDEATADLSKGTPSYQVDAIEVGWISVMDGLWDVYVDRGDRTYEIVLQHRNNADVPAHHLRHIGGLTLDAPTVCVVDGASYERVKGENLLDGLKRDVFENGCVARLEYDELYEWVTFTGHAGGNGLVRKLIIQSGVGE